MLPKGSTLTWRLNAYPDKSGPKLHLVQFHQVLKKRLTFGLKRGAYQNSLFSSGCENDFHHSNSDFSRILSIGIDCFSDGRAISRNI